VKKKTSEINLLIIGSKGFIGSYAVSYFKKLGYNLWLSDIINDYNTKNYYQIDTTNSDFRGLFKIEKYDYCINCSGAASVPLSIEKPFKDYSLNTVNVFKILDAIRVEQPNCKFINLSSAAVYGNPSKLPINEDDNLSPISPYGYHKLYAENICTEYRNNYGIQSCNLRIFSAYGDGLKKQLFWDLYKKSLDAKTINLYGTGNESRDFIHVNDLVGIIELLIKGSDFSYSSINAGNGKELFIKEVVDIFYKHLSSDIAYNFQGQLREGDPSNWVADITRLTELGYRQTIKISQGLESYIKWVKQG